MAQTHLTAVVAEIIAGDSLTAAQAAALVPSHRREGGSDRSRIWRWIHHGFRCTDGRVVKLEGAKFGAQVLTSTAALKRFVAAINAAPTDTSTPEGQPERTPAEARKAGEAAARRLAAAGA